MGDSEEVSWVSTCTITPSLASQEQHLELGPSQIFMLTIKYIQKALLLPKSDPNLDPDFSSSSRESILHRRKTSLSECLSHNDAGVDFYMPRRSISL
ncbi:hypothetical protein AMTR_s00035p00161240 [Amborella trichopoda]|uniref:Uncharacterized protein n=1 Tax=Amborella trichopoda TaxID=13333 RepID=W1PPT8_AMBTC|nr:hypothetical protein AMTR_s00035p00161240 [Amborella trichopoda]